MDQPRKRAPGRPPKETGKDRQTEDLLIMTASSLFMEFGYERVSLEQIAEKCQVTKATIYYYFGSKANLFTQSVVRILEFARAKTEELMSADKPLRERLVDVSVGHLSTNRADFPTMMKEASAYLNEEQLALIDTSERNIHQAVAEQFQLAIQKGELKPLSPFILAHAYSALLMLGNRGAVMERYESREAAARDIISLFLDGASSSVKL